MMQREPQDKHPSLPEAETVQSFQNLRREGMSLVATEAGQETVVAITDCPELTPARCLEIAERLQTCAQALEGVPTKLIQEGVFDTILNMVATLMDWITTMQRSCGMEAFVAACPLSQAEMLQFLTNCGELGPLLQEVRNTPQLEGAD